MLPEIAVARGARSPKKTLCTSYSGDRDNH